MYKNMLFELKLHSVELVMRTHSYISIMETDNNNSTLSEPQESYRNQNLIGLLTRKLLSMIVHDNPVEEPVNIGEDGS